MTEEILIKAIIGGIFGGILGGLLARWWFHR